MWAKKVQFGLIVKNWSRGFPKVDLSDRSARIVLEQINSAKKNYL